MQVEVKLDDCRLDCAKNGEKVLGTDQNPEDISNFFFSEEVLRLANNSIFDRIHCTDDS
jgi:hypothetical protein